MQVGVLHFSAAGAVIGPVPSTLSDVTAGTRCRVVAVRGSGAVRQRLLDMGILPGRALEVLRVAPGAGPLWLRLGFSQIALRRGEARDVVVELLP